MGYIFVIGMTAGCVVYFAPVVIVIGTVFVDDFGFRLFRAPQFYDVDILINGKEYDGTNDVYKCSICSGIKSEKVDSLGHICDSFNGVVDGELNYSCSACGKEYTQTASEIFEKWDSSAINASAEEHPELDVVNDGIINGKDFAKLNHIKNFGY